MDSETALVLQNIIKETTMRDEPSDHFDMGIAQDSRVLVTPSPKPHFVKQKATNLYICAFDVCVCGGGTF